MIEAVGNDLFNTSLEGTGIYMDGISAKNSKTDFNAELFTFLEKDKAAGGKRKRLLLHTCCAPCLSAVLERLHSYLDITVYFYNPNIDTAEEYFKRAGELEKVAAVFPAKILVPEFDAAPFLSAAQGLEGEAEGGKRCGKCFSLRLNETARAAKDGGYDFFATTLTLSPHKNAAAINSAGESAAKLFGAPYLKSDFKKRDGYKRSIELSKDLGLYRQSYCGCRFTKETCFDII